MVLTGPCRPTPFSALPVLCGIWRRHAVRGACLLAWPPRLGTDGGSLGPEQLPGCSRLSARRWCLTLALPALLPFHVTCQHSGMCRQTDLMPLASKLIGNKNPVKQSSFYLLTVVHKYGWSLGNSSQRTVVYEDGERIFIFKSHRATGHSTKSSFFPR